MWLGATNRAYSGGAQAPSTRYVGANGQNISYFCPELPFLNIFKQAGNNGAGSTSGAFTGWFTATSGTFDTLEENYLQLDSDGYPATLTALAGHTQTYDRVATLMNLTPTATPGVSTPYPSGSYTLQFQGAGTIVLGRDVTSGTLATSSPNITVGGLTITSTQAAGVTASVTFTVVPTTGGSGGIMATLTSTDP